MKATLDFNLPEDAAALNIALNAANVSGAILEYKSRLRTLLKHGDLPEDVEDVVLSLKDLFNDLLEDCFYEDSGHLLGQCAKREEP